MNVKWLRKTESQQKVSKKISKKPLSKIHKTWSQCPPLTDAYCSCAHNLTKHVTTKNCGKRVWLFNQTFKSSCVFFPQSLTRPSVNKQILKGKNIVLLQIEQFCQANKDHPRKSAQDSPSTKMDRFTPFYQPTLFPRYLVPLGTYTWEHIPGTINRIYSWR